MLINESRQSRRKVIVCAGLGLTAAVVAACSASSKSSAGSTASSAPADPKTSAGSTASSAPADPKTSGAPSGAITKTADVPVGSGVIVDDVVVTQATAGDFKGFSSVCTHAGCNVSEVTDGKIVCPCHGSKFNLDGTVAQGPAKTPLDTKAISVKGDSIVAG
jgi:Rieske Fe-S protein